MTDLTKIKPLISSDRLKRYESEFAKKLTENPIALYKWNTALSESFYPLLLTLEVGFRNSIHNAISHSLGTENWFQLEEFLFNKESNTIKKVINEIFIKQKKEYNVGKLISELNFGFWTAILDTRYE
mgnify:CR=1 FL=1